MRFPPAVTQEEALAWLTVGAARLTASDKPSPELEAALRSLAEAMAAISSVQLPDDLEPAFP